MIVLAILAILGAIGSLFVKKYSLGLLLTALAVVSMWPSHVSTGEWVVFVVLFLAGLVPALVEGTGRHRKPIAIGLFVLVTAVLLATPLNLFSGWGWVGLLAFLLVCGALAALFVGKGAPLAGLAVLFASLIIVSSGVVWLFSNQERNTANAMAAAVNPTSSSSQGETTMAATSPTSPTAATAQPTDDQKSVATAEAQEWVRRLVSHFAGVTTIPAECQMAKFSVDLTVPEYYTFRPGKESATAFAPDLGKEPCEIARNYVERLFRDSSLAVTKLRSIGVEVIPPEQQVARTDELFKGGFAARRDAARKVLAWYTSEDPYRQLTIEQRDGPYASNNMTGGSPSSAPTVNTTASNKPSTVIVTTDTTTGKVVKMDRANCGPQDFAPLPPGFVVPEPGEEIPLELKIVAQEPASRGNAGNGGGRNADPGSVAYVPETQMTQPASTPRSTPTAPAPTAGPVGTVPPPAPNPTTPRPTPTAEPSVNPTSPPGATTPPASTGTPTKPWG
ncbi:MAG: hypothetical protein WBB39_03495 [Candidatus Saccharimonadales bacterium]